MAWVFVERTEYSFEIGFVLSLSEFAPPPHEEVGRRSMTSLRWPWIWK